MENIDVTKTVYIYDDRSKYDWMLKLDKVLYVDTDTCLCMATSTNPDYKLTVKIQFNILTGEVADRDYYSWIATNDVEWAEAEDKRIQLREKEC
jgi:hypothetical protein